jgi:hypothetical protein
MSYVLSVEWHIEAMTDHDEPRRVTFHGAAADGMEITTALSPSAASWSTSPTRWLGPPRRHV